MVYVIEGAALPTDEDATFPPELEFPIHPGSMNLPELFLYLKPAFREIIMKREAIENRAMGLKLVVGNLPCVVGSLEKRVGIYEVQINSPKYTLPSFNNFEEMKSKLESVPGGNPKAWRLKGDDVEGYSLMKKFASGRVWGDFGRVLCPKLTLDSKITIDFGLPKAYEGTW